MLYTLVTIFITALSTSTLFATPATAETCIREACPLRLEIDRSNQFIRIYRDSKLVRTSRVSTGRSGYQTPRFDSHPTDAFVRPERKYSPVAVPMIRLFGGIVIIGSGSNASLEKPSTHGAIRVSAQEMAQLYGEIREVGIDNTWITVQ